MKSLNILLIAATIAMAKPPSISAAPNPFQLGLGKVYAGYLNLQRALANDDLQKARIASDSLVGALKGIHSTGLEKAAKSHWDSSATRMLKVLHPMTAAKNIDTLRSRFGDLAPLVVEAIEKFGMKPAAPAYLFHCPMAKADWLQKDKVIANPFYGKSMPECGELVREVKSR